jgi:hypothetical protein
MVSLSALWLPILVSAVAAFIASSVIHMLLPWHKGDVKQLPSEDRIREALGGADIPPGDYYTPYASSSEEMRAEAWQAECERGPVMFLTVLPSRVPAMGGQLAAWFIYCAVVAFFAAYLAGAALEPGAHYLGVFRITGVAAFLGYSLALAQGSIWYGKGWGATLRSMADGLVYGLLTGGVFGWLWPA